MRRVVPGLGYDAGQDLVAFLSGPPRPRPTQTPRHTVDVCVDRECRQSAGKQQHAPGGFLSHTPEGPQVSQGRIGGHGPQESKLQAAPFVVDPLERTLYGARLGLRQAGAPDGPLDGGAIRHEDRRPGREEPAELRIRTVPVPVVRILRQDGQDQLVERRPSSYENRPAERSLQPVETAPDPGGEDGSLHCAAGPGNRVKRPSTSATSSLVSTRPSAPGLMRV